MKEQKFEFQNERTSIRRNQRKFFKNKEHFNKCRENQINFLKNKIEVLSRELQDVIKDKWIK